jgi:phytoene/squalene synthetase
MTPRQSRDNQAASITRRASTQTYFIIRFFVDRDRVQDAFRAYAYFRWVDDNLDASEGSRLDKLSFAERQRGILDDLYNGGTALDLQPEEDLLRDLVETDPDLDSGLFLYLDRMMNVMEFDARRRGNLISQAELDSYAEDLAVSVTEAMHYFIGRGQDTSRTGNRYLAVTAAHITHMLRDTLDDAREGYYNIPREVLADQGITPFDTQSQAYRKWVCRRVTLARNYFKAGRTYLFRVKNLRCRLAGLAYTARFEWVLRAIEREKFCLRQDYSDRKSFKSALWITWNTLKSFLKSPLWRKTYITLPPSGAEASQT